MDKYLAKRIIPLLSTAKFPIQIMHNLNRCDPLHLFPLIDQPQNPYLQINECTSVYFVYLLGAAFALVFVDY